LSLKSGESAVSKDVISLNELTTYGRYAGVIFTTTTGAVFRPRNVLWIQEYMKLEHETGHYLI